MPVPIPNIVSGQAIGTAIVAQTSADLSAMSTQGIAIGSLVYNSEVGSHFMLSVSNSALVPGQVLAVNGIDNYRWTLFTGGSASFGIPPNNTYASPTGNEANDGLSWATAKLYASSAFTEVQGLFGGVVNIAPNTLASPVTGTGLNIRGPFDAGIGGVGWLDQSYPFGLSFGQAGAAPFGFSASAMLPLGGTWLTPPLQLAGTVAVIVDNGIFDSLAQPIPSCTVGLSSPLPNWDNSHTYSAGNGVLFGGHSYVSANNANTGHQPDSSPSWWVLARPQIDDDYGISQTPQTQFNNCSFVREAPGGGPALDIGYSFWSWYNQCAFVHDGFVAAPIVDCTVRYNASLGGTSYLQYWNNTRFSGGGIYARGNTQLYGDHLFGENMVQAVVYLDIGDVDLGFPVGTFNDVQSADSISTVSVQNNGRGLITCTDCFNVVGTAIQYNAGIIEEVPALLLAGQVGVGGIVAKLQTDTTRRVFSSTTGPYRNIARPFSWQPGTPLSLVPGPDGMATSAATGATHATIYSLFDAADGYELPAAGDRYVVGAWLKLGDNPPGGYSGSVMANNGTGNINATVFAPGSTGFVPTDFVPGQVAGWFSSAQNVQVGQWFWAWGWIKINSVTAGTRLVIQAVLDPNVISRPWVIRIPAGDGVQDAEIAELALNGYGSPAFAGTPLTNTAPLSPDPGMPALWPGQKLAFWDATLGAWKYLDIDNGAVRVT